jgi:hypothetical protein
MDQERQKNTPDNGADNQENQTQPSVSESVKKIKVPMNDTEVEAAADEVARVDLGAGHDPVTDEESLEDGEVKSGTPTWQWIILAIIIIAIAGVLYWYFFMKSKGSDAPPAEIVPTEEAAVEEIIPPEEEIIEDEPVEEIDTDGDGIYDVDEISQGTDPNNSDTDGDGLADDQELGWGTDPNNSDTDGDGYTDFEETSNGYNPLGEGRIDVPPIEEELIVNNDLNSPEGTLAIFAQAFNNSDADLLVTTLAEDNPDYQMAIDDGASLIAFMQIYFENKTVSFEITSSVEGVTPDILDLQVITFLNGEAFQEDPMKMIKIGEEYKILE